MKRTLLTLGHSTAVTLPPDFLEQHNLKAGDLVEVENTEQGILIRPHHPLAPDFEPALRAVLARYRETLRRLAVHDRGEDPA
ncbi:AbrB/MazE/SpoVT family DNA-binding domain-containing protein [Meiothermus sp.]|uniref:AbrB/MazE/SpoVT family DNA-binding domain-containing protein n=1 Tax=Meiothermus sp. TaxID=1955249 RepID=UPI0026209F90|nr:AbrB/MazE/SpoVT family DNA-binding domain-containing protein [Meiothermus sp.]